MGSETESDVLDIHFGNKTDVDKYRISLVEKNISDNLGMIGRMSTTFRASLKTFLGLPPLQHAVKKEARQVAYRFIILENESRDILLF
jgi:hypothetical protein